MFPLQRNTKQHFWSPWACWQYLCNWWNQESNQSWNNILTTLTDLHFHLLTPREYLNLHLISSLMFCLHFVINYGKISEYLWTPHRLNKFMAKERMGPLVPAIRMLWGTAEKTWRQSFTLIVAVKHCGRFIITGKSLLYFKSSGKVKRKWPIGGRLWILF